jgi:hypothetical protein
MADNSNDITGTITDVIAAAAADHIEALMAPALARVDALVKELGSIRGELHTTNRIVVDLQLRLATQEARPAGVHWVGIWSDAREYKVDEAVTDQGSIWMCLKPNHGRRPKHHAPEYWRLVVKGGRDGKDGEPGPPGPPGPRCNGCHD